MNLLRASALRAWLAGLGAGRARGRAPGCSAHKRNGGRHCCQPPLRRAKDLPVFVTWLIVPCGLPTRSRSWLTSSGVASDRTAPPCEEPDRSTRLRGPKARWSFDPSSLPMKLQVLKPKGPSKTVQCSAALLGMTTTASRFAHQIPRGDPGAASHDRKIISSGASSRLTPARTRKLFPLPAGGDRTFGRLPPEGGRDRRPDHQGTMHLCSESRKRKMWV